MNFMCTVCQRGGFSSKNALNRHRKSHSLQAEHACSVCGLAFHRKDILVRHHRSIHEAHDARATGRQRSQRACDRCRKTKAKCDGIYPCASCLQGGHKCTYQQKVNRLSQRVRNAVGSPNSPAGRPAVCQNDPVVEVNTSVPLSSLVLLSGEYDEDGDIEVDSVATDPNLAAHLGTHTHTDANLAGELGSFGHTEDDMMEMSLNAWGQSTPPNPEDNLEDNPEAWAWMDEELLHHGYTYGGGIFDPYQYNMFLLDRSLSAENASSRISALESGQNFSEHFGVPNQPTVDQHTSIYPSSSNNTARDTIMDSQPMADRSTKPLVHMSAQGHPAYASTRVRQGLSHVSFPVDVTGKARRTREEVIVELINLAFGDHPIAVSKQAPGSNVWHQMSTEVEQAFNITAAATTPTSIHILHGFVSLYFENFHPLWPMIWQRGFDFDAASPILYLTLTAIGSMYSGKCGARYGRMIHKKLCEYLMTTQLQGDEAEEFAISLCLSISLTQVTSLYFGQQNAFSDAQRLGSLLIGYARKFDFCNDGLAKYRECSCAKPHKELSIECLDRWVRSETRKRLVFAMLRAETFLTVLLNTRPLLSYEELNIELPCSDVLWMDKTPGSPAGVPDVGHTLERVHNLLFSDLIRIALDRYEALPILQPADHHMVLCGLQLSVWKFCHDAEILDRMTGENLSMLSDRFQSERIHTTYEDLAVDSVNQTKHPGHHGADRDHLDCLTRRMVDLKIDYERTMKALRKWKTSFSRSFQFRQLTAERSGALLSRLLYHVSFLRMNAAMGPLHLLAYGKSDTQSSIQELILRAYQWSQSGSALIALQHACTIWFLISEESRRPSEHRARFNILAFIALHHAAVVVWAFAGTHESPGELALNMLDPNPTFIGDLRIYRDNTTALSKVFENLLHTISPAWVSKFSNSPAFAIPKDPFSLPPIVAGFAT